MARAQSEKAPAAIPDIRSVTADLVLPPLSSEAPGAGRRVKWLPNPSWENLHCVLTLPENYDPTRKHPLIVEFAGNGGFENNFGDRSEGIPEGSNLGWGISGGRDFVWLCIPFVTDLETDLEIAKLWWGRPPEFSPKPTVEFCKFALRQVFEQFNIDQEAVLICGFSRGAIACNFIGLHDDEVAELWCGSFAYSHFDGSRDWGLPGCDLESVAARLERWRRVRQFPILAAHESVRSKPEQPRGLAATQKALHKLLREEDPITWLETGFRNHNDAWVLRPSPAREAVRKWVRTIPNIQAALERLAE